jgi:hypothetical protein
MSAATAIKRLITGVVEAAFAGIDLGLTIRLASFGRIRDRDPPGIGFEPASHIVLFLLPPASALAAGRAALDFHDRPQLFRRGPLT